MTKITKYRLRTIVLLISILLFIGSFEATTAITIAVTIFGIMSLRTLFKECFNFKISNKIYISLIVVITLQFIIDAYLYDGASYLVPSIILVPFFFTSYILKFKFAYSFKALTNNTFKKLYLLRYALIIWASFDLVFDLHALYFLSLISVFTFHIIGPSSLASHYLRRIAFMSFLIILIYIYNKFIKFEKAQIN